MALTKAAARLILLSSSRVVCAKFDLVGCFFPAPWAAAWSQNVKEIEEAAASDRSQ